jgi:hypothetical protein
MGVFAGVASGAAAVAGAPIAATLAGAAVIGAASSALTTSLGRVLGTYDATPGEQIWDAAFEGIMNAAGVKIAAGVKPTADWIANKALVPMAQFGKTSAGNVMKKLFATYSVGEQNWDTMVQMPTQVRNLMKSTAAKTGKDIAAYHDDITYNQTETIKNIAARSGEITSKIYGAMRNKIISGTKDSFRANLDQPLMETYKNAVASGLGFIERGVPGTKNYIWAEGNDALEFLAKQPNLKGFKFSMYSPAEMQNVVKSGASLAGESGMIDVPYLATDKEAYAMVKDYFNRLDVFANRPNVMGKQAVKDLLDFKKIAGDISYTLANSEKAQALPGIKKILDQARVGIDQQTRDSLEASGTAALFDNMNTTFNKLKQELSPIESAYDQYRRNGNQKVFESLLTRFTSRPGKNASEKFAIDRMIDASKEHGLNSIVSDLTAAKTSLQVAEAAKAFNPIKPGVVKQAMVSGGGLMATGIAVATQNPAWLVPAAIAKGVSSPAISNSVISGMLLGNKFLQNMSTSELTNFMSSAEGAALFTNAILNGTNTAIKADAAFRQQIQSVMQGGQNGQ